MRLDFAFWCWRSDVGFQVGNLIVSVVWSQPLRPLGRYAWGFERWNGERSGLFLGWLVVTWR